MPKTGTGPPQNHEEGAIYEETVTAPGRSRAALSGNAGVLARCRLIAFFSLTCSSINSESTSCLRWSFCPKSAILRSLSSPGYRVRCSNVTVPFSKKSFCQR